ncbi:MAG: hypothetical protein ABJE47_13440 [bacterium]
MTLPDLVFLLSALATAGTLVRGIYLLARRRGAQAVRVARRWAVGAAAYFAILVIVSFTQPQRVVMVGAENCADDWCITVDSVTYADTIGGERAAGRWLIVHARVSSHMRARRQSEPDAYGYLIDAAGTVIQQSERGQRSLERTGRAGNPLGAFVEPDGAFAGNLVFDVHREAGRVGFVKERRSRFPGTIIIDDGTSLFHKRTIVPIDVNGIP